MTITQDLFNILKHKKTTVWPVVIIITIIILAIFVGPRISGYTVYSDKLDECKELLSTSEKSVEELTIKNTGLEDDLTESQNSVSEKENKILQIGEEYETEIKDTNDKYDKLVETFNAIVDNSASNICCKIKLDNPEIDSFSIVDNKISCTTGGTFELDCNFALTD